MQHNHKIPVALPNLDHDSLIKWRDDDTSLYLKDIPLKFIYLSLINAQSELPTDLAPSGVQTIGEVSNAPYRQAKSLLKIDRRFSPVAFPRAYGKIRANFWQSDTENSCCNTKLLHKVCSS